MPTYEYACRSCGKHHEVVQSFGDDPLTECPDCSGPLRKVFGSVGVVFKGSGFYKTDSRTAANGKKADTDRDKDRDKDRADKEKTSTDASAKDGASTAATDAAPATQGASSSSSPSSSSSKPSKPDKTAGSSTAAAS